MGQALPVLDLISKRSQLRRLPFAFKSWKRKYKLAFHLIAGDESAEQEILPAQALLIPWVGCVWHRARAGKGTGFSPGTTLRGEQCKLAGEFGSVDTHLAN